MNYVTGKKTVTCFGGLKCFQVKEMEAILKRRNPNSLPSLMIAAAAAGDNSNQGNSRTAYTEVLESRVKKLEKELEGKDAETDTMLRGVEQKYLNIKVSLNIICYLMTLPYQNNTMFTCQLKLIHHIE